MTTTTQSKAEYLKRYLDGGGTDASEQKRDKKEHKHKKHKRHHHHHHSGMRVIDADEVVAAGGREIYDEDEEEKPQLDEAAAALVAAQTAQRAASAAAPRSAPVSQWEEVPVGNSKRALHDSPDPSPPRRKPERHDSPDPSPPRRKPERHDSPDPSPPRRRPADDKSVGAVSSASTSAPNPAAPSSKMMPPPPPPPPPRRDASAAAAGAASSSSSSSSSARGAMIDSQPCSQMIDSASSTALAAPGLHTHFASQSSAAAEALRGESASAADAMALGAGRATIYRDKLGKKIEPSNTGGAGAGLGAQDDAQPARVKPTWGTGLAQQREKDEWREFARTTAAGPVARHDLDGEEPLMTSDDL
jgi:hypothetical protein